MSMVELKEMLIEKINGIDDELLLQELANVIDFEQQFNAGYKMTAEEIEAVEDGIKQIESGQSLTHEEVKKQMLEWLKA